MSISSSPPTARRSWGSGTGAWAASPSRSASSRSIPPQAGSIRPAPFLWSSTSAPIDRAFSKIRSISATAIAAWTWRAYDAFVDAYVQTARRLFPDALLHWEDLGAANAHRVLDRYEQEGCTFNDDIQGTGAVALAAVLSGLKVSGGRLADQRIVIHGAGTAGIGIARQLAAGGGGGRGGGRAARDLGAVQPRPAVRRRTAASATSSGPSPDPRPRCQASPETVTDGSDWPRWSVRFTPPSSSAPPDSPGASPKRWCAPWRPIVSGRSSCPCQTQLPCRRRTRRTHGLDEGRALVATGSPFPPVDHRDRRPSQSPRRTTPSSSPVSAWAPSSPGPRGSPLA